MTEPQSRLTKLAMALAQPKPPFPVGVPPEPTNPDGPFVDSAATARFIIAADARRRAGCPAPEPTDPTAKFIVETVAKLRAHI